MSTGTDYYTMITRHNGREFQFNVYSYKVDPVIPRWDMETGEENELHVWNEGTEKEFRFHSRKTDQKNGTEIQVPTKKIHRQQVIDAVKNQLLYFKNVDFQIIQENGTLDRVNFQATILYEDEHLIISDNDQFSKPHIILNGVNYGYVDFRELEMQDMSGNVGFKVKPENVEINQSRESLKWWGKTMDAVKNSIHQASITAANIVQNRLDETDFLKWLSIASTLVSSTGSDVILSKLGNIVDKSNIKPKFGPNPLIRYTKDTSIMFEGLLLQTVTKENYYDQAEGRQKFKPKRAISQISEIVSLPLYVQTENTLPTRDLHLLNVHPNGYIKVRFIKPGDNQDADDMFARISAKGNEKAKKWNDRRVALYKYLKAGAASYEGVVVPKEVESALKAEEAAEAIRQMSPEELRKINEQTIIHHIYPSGNRTSEEPTIKSILESEDHIIWGCQEDLDLLAITADYLFGLHYDLAVRGDTKIIMVSKQNRKYLRKHTHVTDFIRFYDKSTNTIGMHNKLVLAQTARKIQENWNKMSFLEHYQPFNKAIYDLYNELTTYKNQHWKTDGNQEIDSYADKVAELQLFIEEHKDDAEAIAVKSKEIFDFSFEGAIGLDLPIYRKLETVLEYIEPIHVIMKAIYMEDMSAELEQEIREILRNKQVTMN